MIKVYSGNKIIYLTNNLDFEEKGLYSALFSNRTSKEYLRQFIENIKNKEVKKIYIQSENLKKLLTTFKTSFRVIEAAGGLVRNTKGEYLFIFRNGKWDLPKGKIESNEEKDTAAIREVYEECGVAMLEINEGPYTTYHVYPYHDQQVLKFTYWYKMNCADDAVPKPQLDEGITEAKWLNFEEVENAIGKAYISIAQLVKKYYLAGDL